MIDVKETNEVISVLTLPLVSRMFFMRKETF